MLDFCVGFLCWIFVLDFCVGFLCWIFVLEKDLDNVLDFVLDFCVGKCAGKCAGTPKYITTAARRLPRSQPFRAFALLLCLLFRKVLVAFTIRSLSSSPSPPKHIRSFTRQWAIIDRGFIGERSREQHPHLCSFSFSF